MGALPDGLSGSIGRVRRVSGVSVSERAKEMNTKENATVVNGTATVEVTKKEAKKVELPEVEMFAESAMDEEKDITSEVVNEALARVNSANNPLRKGEILVSADCEGNMAAFKKALKAGFLMRPEGLENVSLHCAGFAKRDEGLVAKQFAVTLKVNGKWQPLSRYAAFAGGHFALGAGQTLKGAKTLAAMLKQAWLAEKKGN